MNSNTNKMDPILTIIFLTFILLSIIYFLNYNKKSQRIAAEINKIPGPTTYPLIGTSWDLINTPTKELFYILRKRAEKYKPIFRAWAGSTPEVHLMKAEFVEVVMNNVIHIEKGKIYTFLRPWLGYGLLTSFGQRWHMHRKLLTPAFHFTILEKFFDIFTEKSKKLVTQLKSKADGKPFDIFPLITLCTLDMICETAMGVEVNAMDQSNSDYITAIYGISENTLMRAVKPWLRNDFIYENFSSLGRETKHFLKILHTFTNKVIQERKDYYKQIALKQVIDEDLLLGKKKRMAFLDLLIEASDDGQKLSDEDIREEVDTFMFEGHDTTTAGICWSLFLLGNHAEIQDKVAEELYNIFGDDDRNIMLEDLNQMKYLERVIKESLRLYPSVPFITRKLGEDVEIGGYKIPRGCEAVLHIIDIHRDSDQFPYPDVFNPDNFLPEKCQKRHPYAYVPFSAGPRNCIGQKFAIMEEKTVLASILRKYKVHSVEKVNEMKLVSELILRPQKGILITLELRK